MAKHGGYMGGMPGMNMNNLMKQYQKMQKQMAETQEELKTKEFTGQAGGGCVKITVNGDKRLVKTEIDPEVLSPDDADLLCDMIQTAVNQALEMADDAAGEQYGKITGGLGLGF